MYDSEAFSGRRLGPLEYVPEMRILGMKRIVEGAFIVPQRNSGGTCESRFPGRKGEK
jgi:hypothetical protein